MKPITKQFSRKAAFTIVELLTVMSIIVILITLLGPSLNMVKRYAKEVRQKAQFHSIDSAIELFSSEWGGYPPSDALDEDGANYCGAMKLCEAVVGQDLMGFHPNSRFKRDFEDGIGNLLYDKDPTSPSDNPDQDNLKTRKGPYLQLENARVYRLWHLYGTGISGAFSGDGEDLFVLCDVYNNVTNRNTGEKVGMPILYYKANTSNTLHDPNGTFPTAIDDGNYIYNYRDNDKLIALGPPPFEATGSHPHPLLDPATFYEFTRDKKIDISTGRPYRPDSYILISAGFDGIYGTDDDITNF